MLLPPLVLLKSALAPGRRVFFAGGVVLERSNTGGRVGDAECVVLERKSTIGRVVAAVCVAKKRIVTEDGVVVR